MGGVAYNEDGDEEAGMGVAAGDYDLDGDPDLYVTHFFQSRTPSTPTTAWATLRTSPPAPGSGLQP